MRFFMLFPYRGTAVSKDGKTVKLLVRTVAHLDGVLLSAIRENVGSTLDVGEVLRRERSLSYVVRLTDERGVGRRFGVCFLLNWNAQYTAPETSDTVAFTELW